MSTPTHYELRLAGHLDEHWSAWLGGLTLTRETDGTTTLRGIVTDQAELHGLLVKVRDLGATLISINPTDAPHPGAATIPEHSGKPHRTSYIARSPNGRSEPSQQESNP